MFEQQKIKHYKLKCNKCGKFFGQQIGEPSELSNVSVIVLNTSKRELIWKAKACGWSINITNKICVCKKCMEAF